MTGRNRRHSQSSLAAARRAVLSSTQIYPLDTDLMSSINEAQTWNARHYRDNARFVPELGASVMELLRPLPGEHILDVGCGDGYLTARIAAIGARVVGIDSSAELVAVARDTGIDARVMDARQLDFSARFDAVFSNAALHWMQEAEDVVRGVRRALKAGGRFVAEMGGHGNVAAIVTALLAVLERHGIDGAARNPWFFPSIDEYRELLRENGFEILNIALIPRPTPLPTGIRGWLDTFANPFFHGVDERGRGAILDEVTRLLAHSLRDRHGNWSADYVRLRFAARLI